MSSASARLKRIRPVIGAGSAVPTIFVSAARTASWFFEAAMFGAGGGNASSPTRSLG
jgi:hypothetical protein